MALLPLSYLKVVSKYLKCLYKLCLTLECFLYSNWDTESDQEFEGYQTGNLEPLGSGHIGITLDDTIKACERFQRLGVEFSKKQLCISHGDYLRLEHANIF
ncbi:lactoylglutathione lyase-like isoform X2 [Gossypium arboreum]|uniref:lactoylglutathione lyase-like isoform X2 n=1 Tax=Gossypium arboreum TaxID=29729 RepID=UPI0008190AEB|nr:lactoylglutathione lyase-like isoform X2 [Gossypium arboreum]